MAGYWTRKIKATSLEELADELFSTIDKYHYSELQRDGLKPNIAIGIKRFNENAFITACCYVDDDSPDIDFFASEFFDSLEKAKENVLAYLKKIYADEVENGVSSFQEYISDRYIGYSDDF